MTRQYDPMHWALSLIKPDGTVLKDTARNRNARFGKMDVRASQASNHIGNIRGQGLTYDMPKPSRAMLMAREVDAVARDLAHDTDVGNQRIVTPALNKRMMRAMQRAGL